MLHNAKYYVQHTIRAYIKCQDIQHTISISLSARTNTKQEHKRGGEFKEGGYAESR
jgi:hypothetical protein